MRNPNPDISHAHAARHRRAPTAPIHAKIDAELLRRVDAARGDTPRTRVVEAALEAWLERLRAATDTVPTGTILVDPVGIAEWPTTERQTKDKPSPATKGSPEASPLRLRPDGLKPEGALARRGSPRRAVKARGKAA